MSEMYGNAAGPSQGQEGYRARHGVPEQNQGDYQPLHAAPQMDDEFLENQAAAADAYRYEQMYKQFLAEYAIERVRVISEGVETEENKDFIASQYILIARSLERQGGAKAYADYLRGQIYYAPTDGVVYEGRHRRQEEEGGEPPSPPPPPPRDPEATPYPPKIEEYSARLSHDASDADVLFQDPPPPKNTITGLDILPEPEPPPPPAAEPPKERRGGPFNRVRSAWYAGWAAVSTYFMHPEKGHRRQIAVQVAAVLGVYAAAAAAAWLTGHGQHDADVQTAPPPSPEQPQVGTKQFFATLQPQGYHGETYEWGAMASQHSGPQATPQLSALVQEARKNGLIVDTWGSQASGDWGINNVTIRFTDGTNESYYDTPRKLAIMQWFAARDG